MKTLMTLFAAAALAVAVSAEASAGGKTAGQVLESFSVEATVEKVDLKTRNVTLKKEDGEKVTIKAGKEVKNLAQVKKGDKVIAEYHQLLEWAVRKTGGTEPISGSAAGAASAKAGEKPAGVFASKRAFSVNVVEVNAAAGTITIKGPEGDTHTIKPRDPATLKGVKAGDLVDVVYTQAIAIAVTSAPKK
jgi:Cu/Ag efflux protein CusF